MGRAMGQRRHGHFDHDANCATGPFPEPPLDTGSAVSSLPAEAIIYTVSPDPITGEPLYRRSGS
jgi:hypothetical protein